MGHRIRALAAVNASRDTNHSTDHGQTVRVARIDGVDPGTAVAVLPYGQVFV